MIETSNLSLENFFFASKTRKCPLGKQRHIADAFRTVAWVQALKKHVGATSVYQMDGLIEGKLDKSDSHFQDRKAKWRDYRKGRRTPNNALVNQIDASCKGSRALLNHALWDTLRLEVPIAERAEAWLGRLNPDVQAIVWRCYPAHSGKRLNNMHIGMLERRASLDVLACLIMLLRISANAGDGELACRLSYSTCRVLLIIEPILEFYGVARPLAEYVEHEILPLAIYQGQQYTFPKRGYISAAHTLNSVAISIEGDLNRQFTTSQRIKLRIDMLDGRYDIPLQELVSPVNVAVTKPTCMPNLGD